ncbi:hypothetical protein BDV19DRAFT_379370 [Aspergillus venezuelensis]
MSPLEPRQIKRPRLSLSCIVCRRRKVRCGREQPECASCVRIKERCVYKTTVRDEFTGQVRVSPDTESNEPEPQHRQWPETDNTNNVTAPYMKVPSWEEVIRPPVYNEHEVLGGVEGDASSFRAGEFPLLVLRSTSTSTPDATNPHYDHPICGDHLSLRRGARARYIGQAFWGFVAGKEILSGDFFDENRDTQPDLHMFNLIRSLPTKPVSDALLEAFFLAVWPLCPLLYCPTLRADYDEFWDWCRNSETALSSVRVRDDPTFICLLFAILLCGASAAPATSWMCASLQGLQKETIVNHLKSAYKTSLSLCQHVEHPTLNALVSMLLTGPFMDVPYEPMRNLVSVSTIVRIAQSMGLHREGTLHSALGPVDREIRRRAWWCIVWLDVQSSISTGLTPCSESDAINSVGMMADASEKDVGDLSDCFSPTPEPVASEQSIALMFAIGRSETARLQSKIVTCLQSGRRLTERGLKELFASVKGLQQKIDALITRIPSQGIPERGFIPSRLAKASPSTHPLLYKDDTTQPTVLAAWARIMLTLLKFDTAILLQKPFLPPPDSSDSRSCKAWTSMAQLCVNYLRITLQLYQTPAFSPYIWSTYSYYGPLQCIFLTLVYLHCFKDSGQIPLARYCVDEVIDHSISHYQDPARLYRPSATADTDKADSLKKTRMPLAIQVLIDLHSRLDSHIGVDAGANQPCSSTPSLVSSSTSSSSLPTPTPSASSLSSSTCIPQNLNRGTQVSASVAPAPAPAPAAAPRPMASNTGFAPESDSILDLDYLASVSNLGSWSSSLVQESSDILAHPDVNVHMMASDYSVMDMIGLDLGLG